ncbi:family 43 glycosylhydrolase [Saccharicrinis sp. FJH54]|uniref:family 43 glycosylhydrolase n=1 Tax=Saccharicrinis sp. FJH54 TaxID=3344665 RepID=UPI0035D517DD
MAQERPPVHDPVMMKQGDTYYVFSTGWGISVQSSKDLKSWEREKRVFEQAPEWTKEAVEGFRGHMWAPDIAYFNGQYYLFYSVSAFGKNTSCIGLATNKTLDPDDPEFEWVDQGKIIQSYPGKTNWNAIDPNFIVDKDGTPYLTFGSFWDGIKLVKLAWDGKSVDDDLDQIPTIASRKHKPGEPNPPAIDDNPKDAGGNAIEAPFVFKKGKYYYLFASIDYCCKGPRSTYKIIVGRSKDLAGPYKDKDGYELKYGGGTIVLKGDDNWYGIGHNAVYSADGKDYLICHGYDANDKGKSKLIVTELTWDKKKWPVVEEKL